MDETKDYKILGQENNLEQLKEISKTNLETTNFSKFPIIILGERSISYSSLRSVAKGFSIICHNLSTKKWRDLRDIRENEVIGCEHLRGIAKLIYKINEKEKSYFEIT